MGALYSHTSCAFTLVFAIAFRAPEIPNRGGVNRNNGVTINAILMLSSRDSRAKFILEYDAEKLREMRTNCNRIIKIKTV